MYHLCDNVDLQVNGNDQKCDYAPSVVAADVLLFWADAQLLWVGEQFFWVDRRKRLS